MTLKVSGREYTLGVGLRERLLDVPRDRLRLTGTGRAGLLLAPAPGHAFQPGALTVARDHTGRAVTAYPAGAWAAVRLRLSRRGSVQIPLTAPPAGRRAGCVGRT